MDALTFGRRSDLIKIARKRIAENPGKYVDYIYGEWDAGGTAWMVLAPKPTPSAVKAAGTADAGHTFKELGLDTHLGNRPMGELTYGALGAVPMIIAFWPILFGGAYGMTKRREAMSKAAQEKGLKAGVLVKEVAQLCGGNGGGRPDMAMAGGKDLTKVDVAINAVDDILERLLQNKD